MTAQQRPTFESSSDTDQVSFDVWLSGCRLTHTFRISSLTEVRSVSDICRCLQSVEVLFETFFTRKDGNSYEHTIVLSGITPEQASAIRAMLARLHGTLRVRLEHQYKRVNSTARDFTDAVGPWKVGHGPRSPIERIKEAIG
jgi:hypothetical protein